MNITKAESLKDVKAGEWVFVVRQSRYESNKDAGTFMEVMKVGRTYGYVEMYGRWHAFQLDTGHSRDKEGNVRVNGMGFDVYVSKADHFEHEVYKAEKQQLMQRLRGIIDRRPAMEAETVAEFLGLLNRHGL